MQKPVTGIVFFYVVCIVGVAEQHLTYLSHMLHFHTLNEEEKLFEEGSLGRAMYFVSHGSVRACTWDRTLCSRRLWFSKESQDLVSHVLCVM